MSNEPGSLPLRGFLNGRCTPDAQDLLAIRARRDVVDGRLAEITGSSLKRITNRTEIARLKAESSLLGTCEIVAREKVRSNPDQIRNLELFEAQASEAKRQEHERVAQQALPEQREAIDVADPQKLQTDFDRAAWRAKRALARSRSRSMADDD